MIEVHLYGKLRRFSKDQDHKGESTVLVTVRNGDRIADIIERIGIPMKEVGNLIFLNGKYSTQTRIVSDGDRLGLFPNDMQLLYKWHFDKMGG